MKVPVGIVGFRGYSGAELVQILTRHPKTEPVLLEHRSDAEERPVARRAREPQRILCEEAAVRRAGLGVVFLATPPEVSMELAPWMLAAGVKVIDLSGAFRLGTAERYRQWYGKEHAAPQWLERAVYGLPEFYRERVRKAELVANPGCYPTAANLALRPLVKAGVVARRCGVVCDAKSGVSGAGRKPTLKTSFCEAAENFSAYSLLDHRHVPEVLMHAGLAEEEFSFTAHLIPATRGILETIYFRTERPLSAADLLDIYDASYAEEPFVRIYDSGPMPDLRGAQHTNWCDLGVRVDRATGRAVVVSVIDNLGKGAAGQAVQNMNLLLGWDEEEGLR